MRRESLGVRIVRSFMIVAGLAISTSPAGGWQATTQQAPGEAKPVTYEAKPGSFTVRSVEKLVLHDASRNKDLELRITWPDAGGPFPTIVFSHGAFGSKDNYLTLTEYWASYGYVVLQPTHSDSRSLGVRPGDPKAFQDWASRPA